MLLFLYEYVWQSWERYGEIHRESNVFKIQMIKSEEAAKTKNNLTAQQVWEVYFYSINIFSLIKDTTYLKLCLLSINI